MKNSIIALSLSLFFALPASAVKCRIRYDHPCKGQSIAAPAVHWIANVDCSTGAILSQSTMVRQRCDVDQARFVSVYTVSYRCAELGMKPLPLSYEIYEINYRSTGGGYVRHSCDNGQPRIFNF